MLTGTTASFAPASTSTLPITISKSEVEGFGAVVSGAFVVVVASVVVSGAFVVVVASVVASVAFVVVVASVVVVSSGSGISALPTMI